MPEQNKDKTKSAEAARARAAQAGIKIEEDYSVSVTPNWEKRRTAGEEPFPQVSFDEEAPRRTGGATGGSNP